MFHYFLQLNFATILISFFLLIFVNVNPVFQFLFFHFFFFFFFFVSDNAACGSIYYWV